MLEERALGDLLARRPASRGGTALAARAEEQMPELNAAWWQDERWWRSIEQEARRSPTEGLLRLYMPSDPRAASAKQSAGARREHARTRQDLARSMPAARQEQGTLLQSAATEWSFLPD